MKKQFICILLSITMLLSFAPEIFADGCVQRGQYNTINGDCTTSAITQDGNLWIWGENYDGQIGDGTTEHKTVPTKIMDNVLTVLGGIQTTVIRTDGSLWSWGWKRYAEGGGLDEFPTPQKIMDNVDTVAIRGTYAVIKKDGSLWTWGYNECGQLGDGTFENSDSPVKVMNDVSAIALGGKHNAAIKIDGTLWLWGHNYYGQLGDGTNEMKAYPVKIMDNVKSVALGETCSAAVKNDGSLWTWGSNESGHLGDGTTESRAYPVKIMDDVKNVFIYDTGDSFKYPTHMAAIKNDGTLWTWGSDNWGQLGYSLNYASHYSATPTKIMDNVKTVALGWHNAAIQTDGSLWLWGRNECGEIGKGNAGEYTSTGMPTKIMDNVDTVTVSGYNTAAVKTDGSLWTWGDNYYGQIGDGTKEDKYIPTKVLDNVRLSGNTNVITPIPQEPIENKPTENNPIVSDTTSQTIKLGEEKWLNTYIDGIYSEVSENDFSVKSSNSSVINIVNQQTYCGGISNPFDETDISYLTSVDMYVKGANIGTTTLTYYYQNKEIGKIDVTVEPVIADTISDELVLKAKICADNPTYKYMMDTFNNPATLYNNSSSSVAAQMVTDLNGFIDAFSLEFDSKNYYEAVLMDMVTSDTFYDTVKDSLYIDNIEFAADKLNTVGSFAEDEINKLLSDEIKKGFDVDKFFNDISILDTVITAKDSFDAMNDKYKQLTALCLVSEEQICALEQLKDISAVPELTEACDTVIKAVKDANEKAVNKIAAGVFEGVEELFENVAQYGWDSLISLVPGVNAAKAIVASAQLLSNGLFNQDELSNDILLMDAVSVIDGYMDFKVKNTEALFADYPTRDNAVRFMACANFYKALCKYGCTATETFFNHYDDAFITKLTENNQGDRLDAIRGLSDYVDNWNLYNSEGIDISKYLRNVVSETPSEWAKVYVDKAINYGFLHQDMQNNYQNNITRAEFCMLLYNTMALKDPMKFEEISNSVNKKITVEFDDVLFYYVTQIAKMGIINGTGNNKFEPLGNITREQAAKMLCAAAEVMGYDTNAPTTNIDEVSDWAINGVNFVVDRGIMTGTDVGFEPKGTYTKEQSITTMVRFFENLK